MRNVCRIFFSDLKAIFTHFFALVITLSVLVIPALYAWVNIYANWNPYANTGNVPIALASLDEGYTTEDGVTVNKGRDIIEKIAQSTSIRWIVADDAEQAIEAVRAGRYYGVLVMGEHLSRNMYDLTAALADEEPSIVFYQNAKTNAIANKISTTASNTAEHNIQVEYLSVLIENLLSDVEDTLADLDGEDKLDDLIAMLSKLSESLRQYSEAVGSMRILDDSLLDDLEAAHNRIGAIGISDTAFATLEDAEDVVNAIRADALDQAAAVQQALVDFNRLLDALEGQSLSEEALGSLMEGAARVETALRALRESMPTQGLISGMEMTVRTIDSLLSRIGDIQQELQTLYDGQAGGMILSASLADLRAGVNNMQNLINDNLYPGLELIFDGILSDIRILYAIVGSVNNTVADIPPVLSAARGTLGALRGTAAQLRDFLDRAADSTDRLLDKLIRARDDNAMARLIELLHGDPAEFAEFLSAPVEVETQTVYPVDNYGTAMTPFYSTLAIWVGGVVLTAIFKVEAEPAEKKLKRPREGQLFWGRWLLFFVLGQIQAAVIVWGDLHLLGCQCLEPELLYLCAGLTALVFDTLIYSLALAFGDIGKAIVVVVMIVQIAGSSGSYPIEILPPIFGQIYLFFPFPYAINAMREAICGLYESDIWLFLAELGVFGVLGFLIGLVVRRPFVGVNHFIEEEMERSGVL